ncbi:WD40 repeat-like protein [Annulohypoxylon moriforme]|nr:WD40 repeat-like protein [Annulohypoxylon moriforme]
MSRRIKPLPDTATVGSLSDDVALPADAEDTISSLSWSHASSHLAAASWDGKVRIYNVNTTGVARGVAILNADGPVFDCDWAEDGSMVVAGGANKQVHLLDANTGQQATHGTHDAPIRNARFVEVLGSSAPIIATGSWDKKVKYWDIRQQNALGTIECKDRVFSMDSKSDLLVVATAERHIHLIDLKNPTTILKTIESPLKYQTKDVAAFTNGKGWAAACIESRCSINTLKDVDDKKYNFTFRCHREQESGSNVSKIFAVNAIAFHPTSKSVFSTAGSDGTYQFWDYIAHTKLRKYPKVGEAITSAAFNRDGSFYAYAVGYDWSRGCAANTQDIETKIMLHPICDDDVKKK